MFSDFTTLQVFSWIVIAFFAVTAYLGGKVLGKKIVLSRGKEVVNYSNAVTNFQITLRCSGLLSLVFILAKASGAF